MLLSLAHLSTQRIQATTETTQPPEPPPLPDLLKTTKTPFTTSGNSVEIVTPDVISIIRLLQRNKTPLTQITIIAHDTNYKITLETQP